MKICRFGISDQVFCLFSLVQVYCYEYIKKFWNSQPKIALFWKYVQKYLNFCSYFGTIFIKLLWNLCYPLQLTVVPQNILILPPNIENKWKKSFSEESKLCPCWGTVGQWINRQKFWKPFFSSSKKCVFQKPIRIILGVQVQVYKVQGTVYNDI